MSDFFRWLRDEKTSSNQLAVAIRPNEHDIAVVENISLCNDAVRIDLFKLIIPWLCVVLKVRYANDLNPLAKTALVVIDAVAELGQVAKPFRWPRDGCRHFHASRISATLPAIVRSSFRAWAFRDSN